MSRYKEAALVTGWVLVLLGVLCLPAGNTPYSDLSAFTRAADQGAFIHAAWVLMGAGALVLLVARFLRES